MGTTEHLSPLLRKLGGRGLGGAQNLMALAVGRGCRYYAGAAGDAPQDPGPERVSNEELAIALLHGGIEWSPEALRMGAAMVAAAGNDPAILARLARMERCEAMLAAVARAGHQFEPDNPFWTRLIDLLPKAPDVPEGILPHPTRFVAMTGWTRAGRGTRAQWIRPSPDRWTTPPES